MRKFVGLAMALLGVAGHNGGAIAGEAGPSPSGQIQSMDVTHTPQQGRARRRRRWARRSSIKSAPQEGRRHQAVADHEDES